MDFDRLMPVLRRLALEAGDRIMEVYNSPDFEVKSKEDASPVTVADEAAANSRPAAREETTNAGTRLREAEEMKDMRAIQAEDVPPTAKVWSCTA